MRKAFLVTRPFYDLATNYLYYWSASIIKLAESKGFEVFDLNASKANKNDLEGRLKKVAPIIVMFNGHGDKNNVFGQDDKPLVTKGSNESILSGRVVYTRSCESAKNLGQSCIESGTKTYIGYKEAFIFMTDESKTTKPLEDRTAKLFLEPSNQVVVSLLKGNSAEKSHRNGRLAYLKTIQRMLHSESKSEDTAALRFLIWNMRHQVCLGDQKAKL